jgi:hypothetical protein
MVAVLSPLGYFMPIISFLFVFVLIYAVLVKTNILGKNNAVSLMISLMLSAFFIYNASLVEFVKTSAAWFVIFFICVFFILLLITFTHGDGIKKIMNPSMAWVMLAILVIIFVVSSSYVFNWAVNWTTLKDWAHTDWFGFVLLLVMAGIVAKVLTKK